MKKCIFCKRYLDRGILICPRCLTTVFSILLIPALWLIAIFYGVLPFDLVPEAALGAIGLADDAGGFLIAVIGTVTIIISAIKRRKSL